LLFVLPGALVILALSLFYALAADLAWFAALFVGIKAAVMAIVVQALLRIAGRALTTRFKQGLALAAFAALFLLNLPFPLVILAAGSLGMITAALRPQWLGLKPGTDRPLTGARPWGQSLRAVLIWGAVWAMPLGVVLILFGPEHRLWQIGMFFSQLAVVTFGGAYAVLTYMAQEAVNGLGWLGAGEMADGLGLAETTPGPLILVTQFVGFLAAFRAPEPFSPLAAGVIGAGLTTWVTFAPCFLWIFTFAPWIERLEQAVKLKGGLAALTAAIAGVIANLTLWFALHVLFAQLNTVQAGPLRLLMPVWASLDWRAAALSVLAAALLFARKWGVIRVLTVSALGGLILAQL
jgi:chromate transporter